MGGTGSRFSGGRIVRLRRALLALLVAAVVVKWVRAAPQATPALRTAFGHANAFKEGDAAIGVAAPDEAARTRARGELAAMKVGALDSRQFVADEVSDAIMESLDPAAKQKVAGWTVGELKAFCLDKSEAEIKAIRDGLTSEAIAAVAKLMTDDELVRAAAKIYNPPPGSTFGERGRFGSRIQPNSPTDDPEEVLFSVLEGFSYGCGDVVLGINPVDSDRGNVKRLEETLRDIVRTFGLEKATTYCVLAHIDDQMAIDRDRLVNVGFQSLGGTAKTNKTFNIDLAKMMGHLKKLDRQYFETGQGSAFTNNAAEGVDMVTLEARAYGLARAFAKRTGNWTIVNDVAGFIGPEVFASAAQLQRACLEDLFMGKMHGLAMGLDICSTYHMGVEIDELDRIMDRVMEAGPAYYMAVAGKSDPMLSYITTAYRDHPRLRAKHGRKVADAMQKFFVSLGVMDASGQMTDKAGDTAHVYVQYRKRKNDKRSDVELMAEAKETLARLQAKGNDLGYGHDGQFGMPPAIKERLYKTYADAKRALYLDLSPEFLAAHPDALVLETTAEDRKDYVLHPPKGEVLSEKALAALRAHRKDLEARKELPDVQVVVSDGLNAESIQAPGQLDPFLAELSNGLKAKGLKSGRPIIVKNGRVRAGYQVGQEMFGGDGEGRGATVHVVGERPGNGQNTYSVYIGAVPRVRWKTGINHDVVRVVSGVSVTSTLPAKAAQQVLEILLELMRPKEVTTPAP
jgi:ethanolamine ammonia-lyase large subunit